MSVLLKKRKNSDGTTSQFLIIRHNGKRSYEFLNNCKLTKKDTPLDRIENKGKIELAKKIRHQKELQLQADDYEVSAISKKGIDFVKFFEDFNKNYKKKDYRIVNGCLAKFKAFMKDEGYTSLTTKEVNESLVIDFKDYLEEKLNGESPANYFSKFKKLLIYGVRKKIFPISPAFDVTLKKGDNIKKNILTMDEITELFKTDCTNKQVKAAFLFSCLTGLRYCDILALKWKNIDGKRLKLTQQKTQKPVEINLNDDAIEIIGQPEKENDFIFHLPSHTACLKDLKVWCKKAEIKKHITWHCARHSFATNIIFYGSDVNSASSLLGHSSFAYTQRYVHIVESLKEKAVQNLPSLKKAKKKPITKSLKK